MLQKKALLIQETITIEFMITTTLGLMLIILFDGLFLTTSFVFGRILGITNLILIMIGRYLGYLRSESDINRDTYEDNDIVL